MCTIAYFSRFLYFLFVPLRSKFNQRRTFRTLSRVVPRNLCLPCRTRFRDTILTQSSVFSSVFLLYIPLVFVYSSPLLLFRSNRPSSAYDVPRLPVQSLNFTIGFTFTVRNFPMSVPSFWRVHKSKTKEDFSETSDSKGLRTVIWVTRRNDREWSQTFVCK